jgi:VCBS repeat-containing protein
VKPVADTGAKFIITEIKGEAYVRKENGEIIKLNAGDILEEGDVLLTGDGEVTLADESGAELTVPANYTLTLAATLLPELPDTSEEIPAGDEAPLPEATDAPDAPAAPQEQAPGPDGPGISDGGGSSFFNAPKTDYLLDDRFIDQGNLNRDINEIFSFMGRHTENPRIHYRFDLDRVQFPLYGPEPDQWGGGRRDDYTPPIGQHEPDNSDLDGRFELAPDANSVKEDGPLTASGSVLANDSGKGLKVVGVMKQSDPGAPSSGNVGSEVQGEYGTVKINADGTYTYVLNNDDDRVQALAVGEKFIETFVYSATDQRGETQTTTLTIAINGTNDDPKISILGGDSDSAALTEGDTGLTADGTLSIADVDTSDKVTVSVKDVQISGHDLPSGLTPQQIKQMLTFGSTTVLKSGETEKEGGIEWKFDSGSQAFNFLPAGEKLTLTYTVEVDDGHGGKDTHPVTITITGTNDAPTANNDTNEIHEDAKSVHGNVIKGGSEGDVPDTDPDGDELTVVGVVTGESDVPVTDGEGVSGGGVTGQYGNIVINPDGSYTYTPDHDKTNPLKEGEEVEDVFTYTISDGNGGTDTATITIRITGENDPPVANDDTNEIGEDDESVGGNVIKEGGDGDVADFDPDGDKLTVVGVVKGSGGPETTDGSGVGEEGVTGDWGTIKINEDGSYTYTPDHSKTNPLKAGEEVEDAFTYTISDGNGGTDTATVTIKITGLNDAPTPHNDIDYIKRDTEGITTLTGKESVLANDEDPDNDQLHVTFIKSTEEVEKEVSGETTIEGKYGTLKINSDGTYTYDLKNDHDDVKDLAKGETLTDTFTYKIKDEHNEVGTKEATLDIIIKGLLIKDVNEVYEDGPDQEGYDDASDSTTIIAGNILINDKAGNEELSLEIQGVKFLDEGGVLDDLLESGVGGGIPVSIPGKYGSLEIDENGNYIYTLDNENDEVNALAVGETRTEIFVYTAKDDDGEEDSTTLTITIHGANDAPKITLESDDKDSANLDETNVPLTADGTLSIGDVDTSDAVSVSVKDVEVTGHDNLHDLTNDDIKAMLTFADTEVLASGETFNENGIKWNFDSGDKTFDFLPKGATLTFKYTVEADDGNGGKDEHDIIITITGTNDDPVLLSDTAQVKEDGAQTEGSGDENITSIVGGNVLDNDSDVDDGDVLRVTKIEFNGEEGDVDSNSTLENNPQEINGIYGKLQIGADGSYKYILDNTKDNVQELAEGQTDTEIFTYTATDDQGGEKSTTLTITVVGTNDAPEIQNRTDIGDSDSANDLTDKDLIRSGTLTPYDVDVKDEVTIEKVNEVTATPSAEFPVPLSEEDLLAMFDFESAGLSNTEQVSEKGITWTFTGTEKAFDFIPTGQTVTLEYTLRATDSEGATGDKTVTIVIKGTDDLGSLGSGVVTDTNEDVTKTGNVFDESAGFEEDPDYGEKVEITRFTIDGMAGNHDLDSPIEVQNSSGKTIGTFTLQANGDYTFDPASNYSGPVPTITYYAESGGEEMPVGFSTLKITVNPVADAPTINVEDAETLEDTAVSLGLKVPVINDLIDLTDPGDDHDNPERLGEITLSGFPTGAKLLNGDQELTLDNGSVTIKITDGVDENYHTNGLTADYSLTKAQYEALKILPPKDRHENFTVTVKATSYEVDSAGKPLDGIPDAETTETFSVEVKAVTDDVDLKWDTSVILDNIDGVESGSQVDDTDGALKLIVKEDIVVNLKSLLKASFEDLDGSETRWIVIENPVGSGGSIIVNGTTVAPGGKIIVEASGLSESTTGFPNIEIKGGENFSGNINGIKVHLVAQDFDSDTNNLGNVTDPNADLDANSGNGYAESKVDTLTLDMAVMPVAGEVTLNVASETQEDPAKTIDPTPEHPGALFLKDLAVIDTDGSESITKIVLKNIPDGWTVFDNNGNAVALDQEIDINEFKNYTAIPPANSSKDGAIIVSVTTKDTANINGSPVYDEKTVDVTAKVTVTPVAEALKWNGSEWETQDTNDDGYPDLTMTDGHDYTIAAEEDIPFDINQDGFDFSDNWANQDPSEKTYALLSPKIWVAELDENGEPVPDDDGGFKGEFITATGAKFTWDGGEDTFDGSNPVEIPIEALDSVKFTAPPNMAGEFRIAVQAKTVDYDEDHPDDIGKADTAISGEAILQNLIVNPVADKVTVAISQAVGKEDEPIKLDIRPSSEDPNETFNVTILKTSIPGGAKFTYDGEEIDPAAVVGTKFADGRVEITDDGVKFIDYQPGLMTVTPPHNSDVDFNLKIQTVAVDTVYTQSGEITVETHGEEIQTLELKVTVESVADGATLTVQNHELTEAQAETGKITLDKIITGHEMSDNDGSEKLSLIITGLKDEFSLSGSDATFLGGTGTERQWSVDPAKLANVFVKTEQNFNGVIDVKVRAVTTEVKNGHAHEGSLQDVEVTVTPTPEAGMNLSASGYEDTKVNLDFSVVQQNGETDEWINEVWISKADVDKAGVTLYKGGSELVAAPDGWFKIAKTDLENIYAQSPANKGGDYTFEVKYFAGDKGLEGNADVVDTSGVNKTYTLNLTPVTDATETVVENLTAGANTSVSGNTVTLSKLTVGEAAFTIDVKVSQQPDTNSADGGRDTDGSENLTHLIIDGVPSGVMIEGGTYVGNVEEGVFTGRWLVPVGKDFNAESLTETLTFKVDSSSNVLKEAGIYELKVTAFSWDDGAPSGTSSESGAWHIEIPDDSVVTDPTPSEYKLAEVNVVKNADAKATEDQKVSLGDLADFTISGTNVDPSQPFSITLTNLPEGASVEGMTSTVKDGQLVWTASGSGGQEALNTLVNNIMITLPENWNDNPGNPGQSFDFETTITAYSASGGVPNVSTATIDPAIAPVTDKALMDISVADVDEGHEAIITINLSNPADGLNAGIVDGKLYLQLDEPGDGGSLKFGEDELVKTHITGNPNGIPDGYYYVVNGVGPTDSINLTYTPEAYRSGEVSVDAWVVSQETGAANIEFTNETQSFTVKPVNSGYKFDGDPDAGLATGNEDEYILLAESGELIDKDGSEKIISATLTNVPDGFIVYTCSDPEGGSPDMASNAGGGTWSIPLVGDKLPAYIAVKAPENWSGVETGIQLNVYSAEDGLPPRVDSKEFTVEVNPVADGIDINPTQTFGKAGDLIAINLNASMVDTDGSEKVTLTFEGLGKYAEFFVGNDHYSSTYDEDNDLYTLAGITQEQVHKLYLKQGAMETDKIKVEAWTVDSAPDLPDSAPSAIDSGSFDLTISPVGGTIGNDTMLYYTGRVLDGKGGEDTLQLRYDETINFADESKPADFIKNFEIIDMIGNGDQSLLNLSAAHVQAMTDGNNTLTINGDGDDLVSLVAGDWTQGSDIGGYKVFTSDGVTLKIADTVNVNENGSLTGLGGGMGTMMAHAPFAAPGYEDDANDGLMHGDQGEHSPFSDGYDGAPFASGGADSDSGSSAGYEPFPEAGDSAGYGSDGLSGDSDSFPHSGEGDSAGYGSGSPSGDYDPFPSSEAGDPAGYDSGSGSASPSSYDDGSTAGSDWNGSSGDDANDTGFEPEGHSGMGDSGSGSDVIPLGAEGDMPSAGYGGPDSGSDSTGQGGLDEALEGLSADDVFDMGNDDLPLPGGDGDDGLGVVPEGDYVDSGEYFAPDVPDSAAQIADEMEEALSA